MFASLIFRLPAPLRRALAYAKAFALLEDPPPALARRRPERPRRAVAAAPTPAPATSPGCLADRRRHPLLRHASGPLAHALHACGTAAPRVRRGGAVARPKQLCRTPTNGRPATPPSTRYDDRRAAAAGGFLHR